jgi:DNA (cytosine-5)-methyltransferase 1
MKHYGDITVLKGYHLPTTDVVTGGSPCQDLSVAGKRAGLEGARSGLYMEQIRVIKEMRENDQLFNSTEGADIRPRYMVWENVPGAFSSNKGEDFRVVLEEAARVSDETAVIPGPPKGKWHNSGAIMGDGWSAAWRVFDLQFWGAPQRRRRVYLVLDFGGSTAPEVLFKRESLPGYTQKSRGEGQGIATYSQRGVDETSGVAVGDRGGLAVVGLDRYNQELTGEVSPTLRTPQGGDNLPCTVSIEMGALERDQGNRMWEELAPTLRASVNDNSPAHDMQVYEWHNQDSRVQGPIDNACTLNTNANGREGHLVLENPVTMKIRSGKEGGGKGALLQDNLSATLDCSNNQTLFEPKAFTQNQREEVRDLGGVAGALSAEAGMHQQTYIHTPATCLQGSMIGREEKNGPQGDGINEDVAFTLNTVDRHAVHSLETYHAENHEELASTLKARDWKDPQCVVGVIQPMAPTLDTKMGEKLSHQWPVSMLGVFAQTKSVRRLTPLECERLQGFPDGWTDVPDFEKANGKKAVASDSARYKSLGNSVGLPNVYYVLYGIAEQLGFKGTLGSLFDGIGGFPICWEAICGKGTALWASEIEEFPIAVTKYRFGEEAI